MNGADPQPRMRRSRPVTTTLLLAIVATFVFQIQRGATTDSLALAEIGANVPWDYLRFSGEYWRLLTSMFLHGGVPHVAVNLFSLYQLGTLFELMFSSKRLLVIYFATGIAASLTSTMLLEGTVSVGASGAIFGIVGAFILSVFRSPMWRKERVARSIVVQCVIITLVNLAIGFQIPQIDNAAHIGGLVAGLILGGILPHRTPPPPPARSVIDVAPYDG